jgi:hypothetical protein
MDFGTGGMMDFGIVDNMLASGMDGVEEDENQGGRPSTNAALSSSWSGGDNEPYNSFNWRGV